MSYIDSLRKLGNVVSETLDDGETIYTIVSGLYDVLFYEDSVSKKRLFYYTFVIGDKRIYHTEHEFYPDLKLSDTKNIGKISYKNTKKLDKVIRRSLKSSSNTKNDNYLESLNYESYYSQDYNIFGKIPFNSISRVHELIDKKYSSFGRDVNRLMGFSQLTLPITNTNSKLVKFNEGQWKPKKGVNYIVDNNVYRSFHLLCPRVKPLGMINFTGDLIKDYTMLYKILMIVLKAKGKIEILVRQNVIDVMYYYLTLMVASYTSVDTRHKYQNRYISYIIARIRPFIETSPYNRKLMKQVGYAMQMTSTIFKRKKGIQRSPVVDNNGNYSIMNSYLINSNGVISKALELIKSDGFTENQINTGKAVVVKKGTPSKRKRTPSKKKYQPTVGDLSSTEHVISFIKLGKKYDKLMDAKKPLSNSKNINAYKEKLDEYKKRELDDCIKYLELTDPLFPFKPRGTKEGQLEKITFYKYESYGYSINPDIFKKCKAEFSVQALKYIYSKITNGKSTTFKVKDKLCGLVKDTLED